MTVSWLDSVWLVMLSLIGIALGVLGVHMVRPDLSVFVALAVGCIFAAVLCVLYMLTRAMQQSERDEKSRQELRQLQQRIRAKEVNEAAKPLLPMPDLRRLLTGKTVEERMIQHLVKQITLTQQLEAVIAHADMDDIVEQEKQALRVQQIKAAVQSDGIDMMVQPIVSLPQRKQRYFECTASLLLADGSQLSEADWRPFVTEDGLRTQLDNFMLLRCVQMIKRIYRQQRQLGFMCPLARSTLFDAKFFRDFVLFLEDNRAFTEHLVFMIDQAEFDALELHQTDNLMMLVNIGARFALNGVTHLNFDLRKLERHRIRYIQLSAPLLLEKIHDPNITLNFKAMKLDLDALATDIIVNDIDHEPMLLELLELGVDFGQGAIFGLPKQVDD